MNYDLLKAFFKAKQAKLLSEDVDKDDTEAMKPTPAMLGTGMAADAAQKALERRRQLERALYY